MGKESPQVRPASISRSWPRDERINGVRADTRADEKGSQ